jgi:hypothetical protein
MGSKFGCAMGSKLVALPSLVSLSVYFMFAGGSSVLQREEAMLREDGSVVDLPYVLEEARGR